MFGRNNWNLGQNLRILCIKKEQILDFGEKLREEITQEYPKVGNFIIYPINDKLAELDISSTKVKWQKPLDQGVRTQYKVETMADRRMVHDQL